MRPPAPRDAADEAPALPPEQPHDAAKGGPALPPQGAVAVSAAAAPLAGVTALYGGSFDPPHVGHQMACLYLLEALGAEAVWLVPTGSHAFGKPLRPFAHRLAMVQALAAPLGPRAHACAVEGELAGTSTTYGTLEHLAHQHPGRRWAVVVGADLVGQLGRWDRATELFDRAGLVVLGRGGVPPLGPEIYFPRRPWLAEPGPPLPEVSSSALRARLARGEDVTGWMPHAVLAYALHHRLYDGPPLG